MGKGKVNGGRLTGPEGQWEEGSVEEDLNLTKGRRNRGPLADGSAEPGSFVAPAAFQPGLGACAGCSEMASDMGARARLACSEWLFCRAGMLWLICIPRWPAPSSEAGKLKMRATRWMFLFLFSGPNGRLRDVPGKTGFPGPDGQGRPGALMRDIRTSLRISCVFVGLERAPTCVPT